MDLDALLRQIWEARSDAHSLEGEHLDFKRQQGSVRDTQHDIADAAICFANASGGTIVLGISDRDRGPAGFLGSDLRTEELRRKIFDVTEPSLDVSVSEKSFEDVRLVVVEVREGLDVHLRHGKTPTRRMQDDCLPMRPAEISRLHDERSGLDWSAQTAQSTMTNVVPDAMVQLRSLLRRQNPDSDIADRTDGDICVALGLATDKGALTRAGEILLVDSAREVLVYQFRNRAGGDVSFGRRWTGPLLLAFLEVMTVIEARVGTTPVSLPSGQQLQIEDFPLTAIREAVANAVMHGDHRANRPVAIEHSVQFLEIRSPGPLVTGISPSNILTHPPKPRFPALAEAMRSLGLAEKWGQGVDRMFREMIRTGRELPRVVVNDGEEPETSVSFIGGPPNSRVARFVSSLPPADQDDTDVLLVISALMTRRAVDAEMMGPIIQRDPDDAQRVLHGLATSDAPLIEATPRSIRRARPDYRLSGPSIAALGSALAYQARPRADRDRKVAEHVREYEWINNGTIQRMFDLDVHAASDYLKDLVGRELLVRTSEQSRGTAVRYGAGPNFPSKRR